VRVALVFWVEDLIQGADIMPRDDLPQTCRQRIVSLRCLDVVHDLDMIGRIAPTFDLLGSAYSEMIEPAYDLIMARLTLRHPWVMKLLRWKFSHSIDKYERKHFSGQRTGENFEIQGSPNVPVTQALIVNITGALSILNHPRQLRPGCRMNVSSSSAESVY